VRIDRFGASVSVTAMVLLAACSRVHEPGATAVPVAAADAKAASLTKFDWAPPCRVPVRELRGDDDDTRRISYVLELTRGPGDRLELRQRDFKLLELNGEDMTTPEHAAQGPGLLVLDEMVPPLYLNAAGELVGTGPFESDYAKQTGGNRAWPQIEDLAAEQWRTWVGAWVGWTVAPGQTKDAATTVDTKVAGTLAANDHAEHLGTDAAGVKLRLTRTLDAEAMRRKNFVILREFARFPGGDDHYVSGHERTVYSVETDAATLRPAHARFESEGVLELSESGPLPMHRVRDTSFDWAHAEGCKR
jgi:hypothetical protein